MDKIIRSLGNVSVNEDSRHVEGYALLFDTQSRYITQQVGPNNYISFYETISRSAVTQELIDNSDVFALFNHDANKVLARSENGAGTLKLEIDDKGLKYSFDAPNTMLGDELLELLKRGDIHQSSFSCYVDFGDDEMVTKEKRDGSLYLTINKISRLFDVSPVFTPAYVETTVNKRALDIICRMLNEDDTEKHNNNEMTEEDIKNKEQEQEQENTPVDEEQTQEEQVNEEEKEVNEEQNSEDEDTKEDEVERSDEEEENNEENTDEKEEEQETQRSVKNIKINNNHINMKKTEKFSLVNAVRSLFDKNAATEATKAILDMGKEEAAKMNRYDDGKTIFLPFNIQQRDITVTSVGEDLVVTDFTEILEPLRAENVMVKAGCQFFENLNTFLQVPTLNAQHVGWGGEISEADASGGGADSITLTPHRLTAYLNVSKEFLAVDSLGAEAKLRKDLIAAVATKLEETMLSADAATSVKPAGLFYGLDDNTVGTYKDICDLEAEIEGGNFNGEFKYIVDPKAKAALRNMPRSADHTRLVMEGNEIDGEEVLRTTNMLENSVAVGDWSNVVIAQFGAIELTYNPYSLDTTGQVRLTVNAFFDFANTREGSIAYAKIDDDSSDGE